MCEFMLVVGIIVQKVGRLEVVIGRRFVSLFGELVEGFVVFDYVEFVLCMFFDGFGVFFQFGDFGFENLVVFQQVFVFVMLVGDLFLQVVYLCQVVIVDLQVILQVCQCQDQYYEQLVGVM